MNIKIRTVFAIFTTFASSGLLAQTCFDDQPASHTNGQYEDRHDGTILDVVNSLLWSKCNVGETYDAATNSCNGTPSYFATWQDALIATQDTANTTIGNLTGFRMPNIKELASIVDYRCYSPSIDLDLFSTTINAPYWSNTPDEHQVHNQPGYEGLLINFSSGEEFDQLRNGIVVMRLVREF